MNATQTLDPAKSWVGNICLRARIKARCAHPGEAGMEGEGGGGGGGGLARCEFLGNPPAWVGGPPSISRGIAACNLQRTGFSH